MPLEIPDGWFVSGVDLDADEPWCRISHKDFGSDVDKMLPVPKELAYYLRHHFCGSNEMQGKIEENTRRSIANSIKAALRLSE